MAETHTPGPWEASTDGTGYWSVRDNEGAVVALIRSDNLEADARIAAAAPDLLAALEEIRQYAAPLIQSGDVLGMDIDRIARHAIEKVRNG